MVSVQQIDKRGKMYYFTYYIEPILAMIFCIALIIECAIIIKLNIRTYNFEKYVRREMEKKKKNGAWIE